jgi:site-specific DNA-cytosine methylase
VSAATSVITTAPAPHAADLVCGGVPCQSYSLAGKRGGLSDARGQLFNHLLRIAVEAGARVCALENVRGLVHLGALPVILAAFRAQYRNNDNQTLKFNEVVPAARYKSCPRCLGSGKTHPNLMFV